MEEADAWGGSARARVGACVRVWVRARVVGGAGLLVIEWTTHLVRAERDAFVAQVLELRDIV